MVSQLVLIAIFCNPIANFYCAYRCFKGVNLSRVFLEELTRLFFGALFSIAGIAGTLVLYLMVWGFLHTPRL